MFAYFFKTTQFMQTNNHTPQPSAMQEAARAASQLMKALANPDRLIILCQLVQGECCVSDLEEKLGILQPTLSQQLTVLRVQNLVATRRQGKHIYYQLSDPKVEAVLAVLYQQFCPTPSNNASI